MDRIDKVSQEDIKETNTKQILKVFTKMRKLTRIEIAAATGISIPTITNNLNYLLLH